MTKSQNVEPKSKKDDKTLSKDGDPKPVIKDKPTENIVIPVLMFACNRVTVNKAIDNLLKLRKDKDKFPIIVSQVKR